MTIKMQSVESTSIASIGYRYRKMEVKFNNGLSYSFKSVPRSLFDQFANSSSKGEFYNRNIRGSFSETRI